MIFSNHYQQPSKEMRLHLQVRQQKLSKVRLQVCQVVGSEFRPRSVVDF